MFNPEEWIKLTQNLYNWTEEYGWYEQKLSFFCFVIFKMYSCEKKSYRERGLSLVHFPNGHDDWEARNFIRVTHVGTGAQIHRPSSAAFLGTLAGAGWEVKQLGLDVAYQWQFNLLHQSASPSCALKQSQ